MLLCILESPVAGGVGVVRIRSGVVRFVKGVVPDGAPAVESGGRCSFDPGVGCHW